MRRIVGIIALCCQKESKVASEPFDLDTPWFGDAAREAEELREDQLDNPLNADPAHYSGRATFRDYREFQECERSQSGQDREFARLESRAFELAQPGNDDDEWPASEEFPLLWSISLNRRARPAMRLSVSSTKADAARLLFNVRCNELTWAVVDTGIDATHPAFRSDKDRDAAAALAAALSRANTSAQIEVAKRAWEAAEPAPGKRILKTYDFTRLRLWTTLDSHPSTGPSSLHQGENLEDADRRFKQTRQRLRSGQSLDWPLLEPLLRVSHETDKYARPGHDHGTHVAGILGGAPVNDTDGQGMCPDINLVDLRVLDDDGKGDEFSIIAALQFIRHLNATGDQPVIHGVNLSLSLLHDVENYACGRTPICEECERLVASGVVVVAAAGLVPGDGTYVTRRS